MADKKKKDDKPEEPEVDQFSKMSTKDLVGKINDWYANTKEAAEKREKAQNDLIISKKVYKSVINNYFVNKRGKVGDDDSIAKSYALDDKDPHIEATELLYKIGLKNIEAELGEEVAVAYKKNPEKIVNHFRGKGIDFEKLHKDLIDHADNVEKSEMLDQVLEMLSQESVTDIYHINHVQEQLMVNSKHHKELRDTANTEFGEKHGKIIKPSTSIDKVLSHYIRHKQGNVNEEYLLAHRRAFGQYKKD